MTPELLFALQTTRKGRVRFLPEGGIEIDMRGKKWADVHDELQDVLHELGDN